MGTTKDKLQKLVTNKQALVNVVNEKSATEFTVDSNLGTVIEKISEYVDPVDATVTADVVLENEIAYNKDGKVTGNVKTYDGSYEGDILLMGDGLPLLVSTPEAMHEALTEENKDKLFKYIGETTEEFISGEVYMITEVE